MSEKAEIEINREDEKMFSMKYLKPSFSSTVFDNKLDGEDESLKKRSRTEPLESVNGSMEIDAKKPNISKEDINIPSVASILGAPPHKQLPCILDKPALPNSDDFTPFLLPNPSSYYNPLNPPRSLAPSFPIAPIYSSSSYQLVQPKESVLRESKVNHTSNSPFHRNEMGQANNITTSPIHFPLSDSPAELFKRGSERLVDNSKSNTNTEEIGGGPPLITTDNATTTNRFILVEQPNDIQRKSYKKENRCLLPNPLIICLKEPLEEKEEDSPLILDGMVSLKLVNNDGSDLPPHKQNALESIEGGLSHSLGDDHTTCFSVKVLQTSEGNLFRLVFNVTYRIQGQGEVEEQIVSRPFAVYSNKHNRNSRKKKKDENGSNGTTTTS